MEFITYLVSMLLAAISGFVGLLIAHHASEELNAGKKYFAMIEYAVFILLLLLNFLFFRFKAIPFIVFAMLVIVTLIVNKYVFSSMVVGLLLTFFMRERLAFFLAGSLVIIHFFITASNIYLAYLEKKMDFRKLSLEMLFSSGLFLVVGVTGYFVILS